MPPPPRRVGRLFAAAAVAVVASLVGYIVWSAPRVEQAAAAAGPSPVGPAAHEMTASPSTPAAEDPPPMPVQSAQQPTLGISAGSIADLDRFIAATGTRPEVYDVFEHWSHDRPLDRTLVEDVAARGARLSITWEPWDPQASNTDQPDYGLASIIAGAHDPYIDMFATSIKELPYEITLRLMHEMNGNWYPWAVGANGNRIDDFVSAWQHVHDRFTALGVTNVQWMWAPNALYTGSAPLAPLYPGDAYVDEVGISNYNWGDRSNAGFATRWRTFSSLFDPSITQLRSITSRPLWITEVASSNEGGSKAEWMAAMLAEVAGRPEIAGLLWFDHRDDGADVDWRIETEPDAVAAWRAGFLGRPARP